MSRKKIITIALIVVTIAATVIALIFAMQGSIKTTGTHPDDIKGVTLTCESHSIKYPIFAYDEAKSRDLKITMNFYEDRFSAASLSYALYYDTEEQITSSEAHNHAAMNIDFGKSGLKADAFSANYSKIDGAMKMILYVKANEYDKNAAKYFMINVDRDENLPKTISEFRNFYKSQGFSCSTTK
ncbi:hypothetical protein IJI79_02955 [Candidatus Saccharibacteria bacterium]|nr:hypothetical protein [Candidatus Saccharibacteria bacterium]